MNHELSVIRSKDDALRYIAGRKARRFEDPSLRRWQIAGRAILFTVLGYATVQYYFLHVFVEILSLPGLTTFAG